MSKSIKPRLAYLFSRYPVVSQTFVDNEILGLEEAGWEVVIGSFSTPKDEFRHPRLNALKAPVLYPPPPEVLKAMERHSKDVGTWPTDLIAEHEEIFGADSNIGIRCRNALGLAERLKALEVDHVHLHFANRATHTAIFLKALSGIPFSFTPQGQDFLVDTRQDMLAEYCREAKFVVAPCEYARDRLAELCPDSVDKFVVIYNGVDPSAYEIAKPAPKEDCLRISSVGRLIEFKGFHHLIPAIGIAKKAGVRVELELGGDGPWREQLEKQAKDLGLDDQIYFLGTISLDEMKSGFLCADAFVLASITDEKGAADMFPTVITEAMFSGLPIVSTRLVGIPEQVEEGITGLLTDQGDESALAEALIKLAREPGLAAKMGAAGRERALARFDRAVTREKIGVEFQNTPGSHKTHPQAELVRFYDWDEPGGIEKFRAELDSGGAVWVAAGSIEKSELDRSAAAGEFEGVNWLADGMVLEMEWRSSEPERVLLTEMRSDFGDVDGEDYFKAARRAVWLATAIERRGGASKIEGAGDSEKLVARLIEAVFTLRGA
ncbi:MAG: glycosyltransferase involved in cell wall biosynthesis [Verrucomicrobiales bacterium]|jgi:glycosyltransferase involved in cell wall biosynthesis